MNQVVLVCLVVVLFGCKKTVQRNYVLIQNGIYIDKQNRFTLKILEGHKVEEILNIGNNENDLNIYDKNDEKVGQLEIYTPGFKEIEYLEMNEVENSLLYSGGESFKDSWDTDNKKEDLIVYFLCHKEDRDPMYKITTRNNEDFEKLFWDSLTIIPNKD